MIEGAATSASRPDGLEKLRLARGTWSYADLSSASGFSVAPTDGVYLHCMIHGELRLACAGGAHIVLRGGDAMMVLSGEAHALRTAEGAAAPSHVLLRERSAATAPSSCAFGPPGRPVARVLSARLDASWPEGISRRSLPALLALAGTGRPESARLVAPDAFARAGVGAGSSAVLTCLAELLLIAALREGAVARSIFAAADPNPIADALALVAADPAAAWTVASLARAVGMGRSNFAARFAETIGRAPMEVVAEYRMEHAARLLREGRLKVAEISELAGYGSEAAFSRRFTRHFGMTPSRMRESARAASLVTQERPGFRSLLRGTAAALDRRQAEPAVREPRTRGADAPHGKRAFIVPGWSD
ncbi:hypothetical protein B2G71_09565 [Novosphingobium sp. PC22D]|uniref:AraC family transcriptional regulator n=1 Tax=Novosphingobium sp. PC22D TaxID=1962403 RepID=UPI000BFAC934|nr:AraC family transcriptional regulator [Novosphingobium sp. PC22D]PEQ13059.1 hypothetical protein B2G71_09565 [Novosphingobium sp. PC22D]